MQFSESWLRALVDPPLGSEELAHVLTMAGLEVESTRPVAPPFSGVVVAQILSVEPHRDADKLKLCRVDAGQASSVAVVCGAPNATGGMKTPFAVVGAQLPGGKVQAARIRGIDSFGMLCSARELGISEDQSGLLVLPADAPVGSDVRDLLDLDDRIFTLKLTPNRSDCLSVAGVAREIASLTGAAFNWPSSVPIAVSSQARREIVLDAPAACPRYVGRAVSGIDARAPTPEWMKRRLERSGVRSISAVVDVTNYVMLEIGQPLHAFDNDKLVGAIHVRFARERETLVLLNGQSVEPAPNTLLIADDARALALAGIMGGEESGITLDTTELFLESAFFAPEAIAGKARALGLSSDASHRFERGVDFAGARNAIERATELVLALCGGQAGPITEACAELPARHPVRLRAERAKRVLGIDLGAARIEALIAGLRFESRRERNEFVVTPPSHRFDIAIEEDLIEELARVHGYDNIPAPFASAPMAMIAESEGGRSVAALKRVLVGRDYQEVINFSFVDAKLEADFCANPDPVALANPISAQMGAMRSSLIGGLATNLASNLRRRIDRVRIFEVGRCFVRADGDIVPGFAQPLRIGGLCAGPVWSEQWGSAIRAVDFFDVKADVEAMLAPVVARFDRFVHPALHPGRAARVSVAGRGIGIVGELHPELAQKHELGAGAVVFELDLEALLDRARPAYREVSRFPAVVRDLALVVPGDLPVRDLVDVLREAAPPIVQDLRLFDLYQGPGVDADKKSVAIRIVMQDTERTLEDADADSAIAVLVEAAGARLAARLRG